MVMPGPNSHWSTHVSMTDPDAKLANKGNGTVALVGDTVNGVMENRHRAPSSTSMNVAPFRGPASETDGGQRPLDRFHQQHRRRIQTVGMDKGYFAKSFLTALLKRRITSHVAPKTTGRESVHQRVRRLSRTVGYRLSQRARRKIEERWGEAKCWHGCSSEADCLMRTRRANLHQGPNPNRGSPRGRIYALSQTSPP